MVHLHGAVVGLLQVKVRDDAVAERLESDPGLPVPRGRPDGDGGGGDGGKGGGGDDDGDDGDDGDGDKLERIEEEEEEEKDWAGGAQRRRSGVKCADTQMNDKALVLRLFFFEDLSQGTAFRWWQRKATRMPSRTPAPTQPVTTAHV